MTTYAIINGEGVITNRIILYDADGWELPEGFTLTRETETTYEIGGTLLDGVYTPPERPAPPPPPVPTEISDRQFFQQLAIAGIITPTEAIAAVATGTIPAALKALVNQLPTDQMFGATMLLSGDVSFSRTHPLTAAIGAAYGMTAAQIDALWTAASKL
jgi:hypothetical protein